MDDHSQIWDEAQELIRGQISKEFKDKGASDYILWICLNTLVVKSHNILCFLPRQSEIKLGIVLDRLAISWNKCIAVVELNPNQIVLF